MVTVFSPPLRQPLGFLVWGMGELQCAWWVPRIFLGPF